LHLFWIDGTATRLIVAPRTQRWQFYNDANVIGVCDSEEGRRGDYKHTRKLQRNTPHKKEKMSLLGNPP
jgi:hypothetical protein